MNSTRLVSSFSLIRGVRLFVMPLTLATLVASCGEPKQQGGPPPPAVTVATPVKRTVFDYDEYVGRFAAINAVEVRARVSGYLDKLQFKDGQLVKQGDLLFTIDKRPFQNTLDQARANLVQAQSNVAFTESDYTRGQQLVRDKTITDQTFEQRAQAFRKPRHRSQRMKRRYARPNSTWNSPNCVHRSTAASVIGGSLREILSPAARVATPHCSLRSCRSIRFISNSPSTKRRIYATSGSPGPGRILRAAMPVSRSRSN